MLRTVRHGIGFLTLCMALSVSMAVSMTRADAGVGEETRQAIEQASRLQQERPDFQQAATAGERERRRSRELIEKLGNPVAPSMPKIDLMKLPQQRIDVLDLANQGRQLRRGATDGEEERYRSQILVFVSASMPERTLRNYLEQTARIQAALVFRGFKNNQLADMKAYLAGLMKDRKGKPEPTILIDPTLFERFGIEQVPVTVVTETKIQPCGQRPCPAPVFLSVSGDVSLGWALGLIARQAASEKLRASLRPLIDTMENGS